MARLSRTRSPIIGPVTDPATDRAPIIPNDINAVTEVTDLWGGSTHTRARRREAQPETSVTIGDRCPIGDPEPSTSTTWVGSWLAERVRVCLAHTFSSVTHAEGLN